MPVYASEEQLYTCFKALFKKIAEVDEAASETLLASKLTIRFRCSEPSAEITFDARKKPVNIIYGSTTLKPVLDISLSADTLHEILLGEIGLTKAIGSRRMKPKGPIMKVVALEPLFHDAQSLYPGIFQNCRSL